MQLHDFEIFGFNKSCFTIVLQDIFIKFLKNKSDCSTLHKSTVVQVFPGNQQDSELIFSGPRCPPPAETNPEFQTIPTMLTRELIHLIQARGSVLL